MCINEIPLIKYRELVMLNAAGQYCLSKPWNTTEHELGRHFAEESLLSMSQFFNIASNLCRGVGATLHQALTGQLR